MLRRLAPRYGRLLDHVMVKEKIEKIEVLDEILASGGFSDVRRGMYHDHPIAVKTVRVAPRANLQRIRKVSIRVGHPVCGLDYSIPAILQGSHPMELSVPSERLETCWNLW